MSIDLEKYDTEIYNNIDIENLGKIVKFMLENNCDYIDSLIDEYLDIFTFDYDEFIRKYNIINKKYNGNLIEKIRENMNILEEFYLV